jgi:hypothetical protein
MFHLAQEGNRPEALTFAERCESGSSIVHPPDDAATDFRNRDEPSCMTLMRDPASSERIGGEGL